MGLWASWSPQGRTPLHLPAQGEQDLRTLQLRHCSSSPAPSLASDEHHDLHVPPSSPLLLWHRSVQKHISQSAPVQQLVPFLAPQKD